MNAGAPSNFSSNMVTCDGETNQTILEAYYVHFAPFRSVQHPRKILPYPPDITPIRAIDVRWLKEGVTSMNDLSDKLLYDSLSSNGMIQAFNKKSSVYDRRLLFFYIYCAFLC